jgi:ElaB/YqjD/DUF883 family membrane-anchored ribosome-binding protein
MSDPNERVSEEMDNLKSSFVQLKKDVTEMVNNAVGVAKTGAESAKDGAAHVAGAVKDKLKDLKDRSAEHLHVVEEKIAENPLPAALIAFGVGFLIAKLFSSRR